MRKETYTQGQFLYGILCGFVGGIILLSSFLRIQNSIGNPIRIGDTVRCGDLVSHQYDGEIMYMEDGYYAISGTDNATTYPGDEGLERDDSATTEKYLKEHGYFLQYGTRFKNITITGERVFQKDDCFRPDNYHDLIQREKSLISKPREVGKK